MYNCKPRMLLTMCQDFNDIKQFIEEVESELSDKMRDEPYPINLLEEVHLHDDDEKRSGKRVSENAHTRILRKMLAFTDARKGISYPLLKSLLNYVGNKSEITWKKIADELRSPQIYSEYNCDSDGTSGRIDLLVKEKGKYAIVFENKINDAVDQKSQIARYIRQMEMEYFSDDQIFVLYLSSEGNEPSEDDWEYNGTNYSELFQTRYFNLSYRDHILPWLEEAEKDIPGDQPYLIGSFNQYIDYLKGKFALREKERISREDIFRKRLKLSDDDSLNSKLLRIDDKIKPLAEFIDKLRKEKKDDTQERLRKLRVSVEILRMIKTDLLDKAVGVGHFEKYTHRKVYERDNYLGYKLSLNNRQYLLYIGWNRRDFFCSVISFPQHRHPIDPISDRFFRNFFDKGNNRPDWRASYYNKGDEKTPRDYQGAVEKMKEVLTKIVEVCKDSAPQS